MSLLAELERARIVADGWVSAGIVRMGSIVTFKPDTGDRKTVTLVFPGDADISEGKVSILTPIGTALIGLSAGQSIMWTARDGRRHELLVLDVSQPAPEGDVSRSARASVFDDCGGRLDMGVSIRLLNHAGSLIAGVDPCAGLSWPGTGVAFHTRSIA